MNCLLNVVWHVLKDCLLAGVKYYNMSKKYSKEKGDKMYGGWAVCRHPVSTVRRALAIAELSGSDTVSINISLERLVDLTHTVAGLVGQQLDEAVGQEKMSSDVEPGDGYGNRGAAASSCQLKKHVNEERIKSDLDPHVDQEPH